MFRRISISMLTLFTTLNCFAEPEELKLSQFLNIKALKNAQVVLLGESHNNGFSIDEIYETVFATAEAAGFDCFFIEMPKYIFQESYSAFSAGASFESSVSSANKIMFTLPFFPGQKRQYDWSDPRHRDALFYRHQLLTQARNRNLKLFAIDTDYRELNIPNPDRGGLEERWEYNYITRNLFMAGEIINQLNNGQCKRALVSLGAAHLYARNVLPISKRKAVPVQDLMANLKGPVMTIRLINYPMSPDEDRNTYQYVVTP